jgi:hypothetical protein
LALPRPFIISPQGTDGYGVRADLLDRGR